MATWILLGGEMALGLLALVACLVLRQRAAGTARLLLTKGLVLAAVALLAPAYGLLSSFVNQDLIVHLSGDYAVAAVLLLLAGLAFGAFVVSPVCLVAALAHLVLARYQRS